MSRNSITAIFPLLLILLSIASSTWAFTTTTTRHQNQRVVITPLQLADAAATTSGGEPSEVIARKIIVRGDVDGGYYRSCVKNEGGRFRQLSGTMSPPDDSKKAEILVEGKRKMVDGFIRWCQRGNVGLSQTITVESIHEEEPTGLYDDFYVPTGRE